jgi:hypothetical protein
MLYIISTTILNVELNVVSMICTAGTGVAGGRSHVSGGRRVAGSQPRPPPPPRGAVAIKPDKTRLRGVLHVFWRGIFSARPGVRCRATAAARNAQAQLERAGKRFKARNRRDAGSWAHLESSPPVVRRWEDWVRPRDPATPTHMLRHRATPGPAAPTLFIHQSSITKHILMLS